MDLSIGNSLARATLQLTLKPGVAVLSRTFVMKSFAFDGATALTSTTDSLNPRKYPPSEACGIDGFTLADKNSAFAKLRELANADAALPMGPRKQ
jgi:hypothetical protein